MAIQRETLLHELINNLKRTDNERLLEAMAREINNHIFIRATLQSGTQELTSDDMQVVLTRFQIIERTLALSERGQGPEAFAPKPKVTPLNPGTALSQSTLDGLEKDLRSSRGGRT